jgi:predicted PurR-regulated permease PerM
MKPDFLSRWYMLSIISVITIAALILAKQLLIPLTLGLFLSLGLSPLVERLKRWGVNRVLSIFITFIVGIAVLAGIMYTIGFAINNFVDNVPTYATAVEQNISVTKSILMDKLALTEVELTSKIQQYMNLSGWGLSIASIIVTATGNILATFGLSLVITFFLLLYRERIKKFFELVADKNRQEEILTIVRKSFRILPRYILGLLLVIGIMTVLNTLGFWLIGVKSPLFWGIIVSLLNVIPYVGTIIGFGAVTIFALIVSGPLTALFTIIMFLVVQFVDNNFLTPRITGGQIAINSLAAIIFIIIWGMIWGVVGMVLALPILGLIKIICDTFVPLQPIGYLLGDKE